MAVKINFSYSVHTCSTKACLSITSIRADASSKVCMYGRQAGSGDSRHMSMNKQLNPPNVAVSTDTSVCGIHVRLHIHVCTYTHMHELVAFSVSGMDRNHKSTLHLSTHIHGYTSFDYKKNELCINFTRYTCLGGTSLLKSSKIGTLLSVRAYTIHGPMQIYAQVYRTTSEMRTVFM